MRKFVFILLFFIFGLFNLIVPSSAHEDLDIIVSGAWVAAMPPTQTITAAYMTITNTGKDQEVLVSVVSPVAGAVELHQMSEDNGMMKMAKLDKLIIPKQGKVELSQGGYHLMLINLVKPLQKGDVVPIYLKFDCGCTVEVKAKVQDGPDQSSPSSSSMGGKSAMGSMSGMKM